MNNLYLCTIDDDAIARSEQNLSGPHREKEVSKFSRKASEAYILDQWFTHSKSNHRLQNLLTALFLLSPSIMQLKFYIQKEKLKAIF